MKVNFTVQTSEEGSSSISTVDRRTFAHCQMAFAVRLAGFPRSWKIIENPGKIHFPGKTWKIYKNVEVMEKLKNL